MNETVVPTAADHEREDWGGILVNSETVVKTDSKSEYSSDSRGLEMGVNVAVSTTKQEDTFVDELMAVTRQRFMQNYH